MRLTLQKIIQSGCVLASLFCVSANAATKNNTESLDGIVAVVNETVITQSDLNDALKSVKKQMLSSQTPMPPADILRKRVLDQLIDRKLQLLLVEQAGAHITDEQLNKAVASIADQNKISVKELYAKIASQGIDLASYHKEIREEMLLQQIQHQEVGSKIVITPQEVDDFMRSASWKSFNNKEYHLEDILITLPEAPSPQALAQAKKRGDEVLAKLHKGMSFAQVAMEESGDDHALQGGDLGWLKLPQIPTNFANELVHMKQNDILGPVATPNGYHIIRLAGLRDVKNTGDLSAQRQQVQQLLYQRKLDEGLQSWITKLRSEGFVNKNPEG
jgi:peptidyl-prolyl cis-trans isomerase SurA